MKNKNTVRHFQSKVSEYFFPLSDGKIYSYGIITSEKPRFKKTYSEDINATFYTLEGKNSLGETLEFFFQVQNRKG